MRKKVTKMRLIDADALMEDFTVCETISCNTCPFNNEGVGCALWEFVRHAPTIDAVPQEEHVNALNDLAVAWKNKTRCYLDSPCPYQNEDIEVKEPSTDLIRRADAIEAVRKEYEDAVNVPDNGDAIAYDVERLLSALPSADMKSWNGLYIKVYADDDPQDKAEKLYQICDSNEALSEVAKCIQGYLDEPSAEATCATCADRAVCIMSAPDGNWKACKDYRPSAEAGWIPCSERLPDVDVEVLATVDWSDVRIAWLKKGGTWETDEYILGNDEILAWMPLPKPYKGGGSE